MSDESKTTGLTLAEGVLETEDAREVYLEGGRSLRIQRDQTNPRDEVVEIRAASGAVELRVVLTEAGPVLSLEGVRLSMKSVGDVDVQCDNFRVKASETVELEASEHIALKSHGELRVASEKELTCESEADVRVRGKMVWIN